MINLLDDITTWASQFDLCMNAISNIMFIINNNLPVDTHYMCEKIIYV